jgi:hypothetical protein
MNAPIVYPKLSPPELAQRWNALAGAQEVILVEMSGCIRSFGAEGERDTSVFGLALMLPPDTYPR